MGVSHNTVLCCAAVGLGVSCAVYFDYSRFSILLVGGGQEFCRRRHVSGLPKICLDIGNGVSLEEVDKILLCRRVECRWRI